MFSASADVDPQSQGADRRASNRRRALVAAAIVLASAVAARLAQREAPVPPQPSGGRVVFVDTAGWYGRTTDEVAVLTPYELTIDALPGSLPLQLGDWTGADRAHDVAVDRYLDHPDMSMERTYWRGDDEVVWLTAFGSRGRKSFRLFEHTPETCYPLGGWSIEQFGILLLDMGPLPMPVNRGVASGPSGEMVFIHFYVWDSPDRDSQRGVLTFRVAAPVAGTARRTLAMLTTDFLPGLLGPTIPWSRF